MKVSLELEEAKDLILFKLQHLQQSIKSILKKWDQETIEKLIFQTRTGALPEAEMDVITVRQLEQERARMEKLFENVTRLGGET